MTKVRILSAEHGDVCQEIETVEEAERILEEIQREGREGFTPDGKRIGSADDMLGAEEVIVPFRPCGG